MSGLEKELYRTIIQCYKELTQNNQDAGPVDLLSEVKRFPNDLSKILKNINTYINL